MSKENNMQVGDKVRVLGTDGEVLGDEYTIHLGGGVGMVTQVDENGFEVKFPKDTIWFAPEATNDVEVIS